MKHAKSLVFFLVCLIGLIGVVADGVGATNWESEPVYGMQGDPYDCTAQGATPVLQCEALVAIYEANPAGLFTGWLAGGSLPCEWSGVVCVGGNVTQLALSARQITTIPSEIGQLNNLAYLYLFSNQITSVPAEIGQLNNLLALELQNNQITAMPVEIGLLSNLQTLYLNNNTLAVLPNETWQLANLQRLDLSSNQFAVLPPEIGQLTSLERFNLRSNQFVTVPVEIGQLNNLQVLELQNNDLVEIPIEIEQLNNLQTLYLYYNELTTIPTAIGQLSNLQWLDLSNNQLTSIPIELGQLNNLQRLYVSFNELTALPAEIGQLSNLQRLYASNNQLATIPTEVWQLSNLQWLDLSKNQLTTIPADIEQLVNLQSLALGNNSLTTIPTEIGQLSNLQTLDLGINQITTVPIEIGNLTSLISLSLSHNQLLTLPVEIGNLSNLRYLYLSYNTLTPVPESIWNLSSLYSLHLSNNQLADISVNIENLIHLKTLDLSRNLLVSIPVEIGNLSDLEVLSLWNNQLTFVPAEIGQLSNLQILDVGNNQLRTLPPAIGNLTNLQSLSLNNNQLCSLPISFANLTLSLGLDVSYNHLAITNPALLLWLNTYQPNWTDTQTPCPPSSEAIHLIGYVAFDNNLASYLNDVLLRLQAGTAANPNVIVTALVDGALDGDSRILHIANGEMTELTNHPFPNEVNMAEATLLADYLIWARAQQTGMREVVSIIGHGAGLTPEIHAVTTPSIFGSLPPLRPRGYDFTPTDVTSGTYLSTSELGRALAAATDNGQNPFDLVFFDGCFYGSFDALYEIRGTAEYFIATPNYGWGGFFYDEYLAADTASMDNEALAQHIIETYTTNLDENHPHSILWVRGADLDGIATALDTVAEALQTALASNPTQTVERTLAATVDSRFIDTTVCEGYLELAPPDQMVDARSFAQNLQSIYPAGSGVYEAAGELLTALATVQVSSQNGSPWINPDAYWDVSQVGLTIIAPLTPTLATQPDMIWLSSLYIADSPVSAVWSPNPSQQVIVEQPWASSNRRWAEFLADWYGSITPTVGQFCHLFPAVEGDVPWPVATAVTPNFTTNNVATEIFISGSDFVGPVAVTLGGQALDVIHSDSTLIVAIIPAGMSLGWHDLVVQTMTGIVNFPQVVQVLASEADDLRSSPDWLWTEPLVLRQNRSGWVGLTLQRVGGISTLPVVEVAFEIDGLLVGRGQTQPMAPNSTEPTSPVSWTPPTAGQYELCATIDPDGTIPADDPSNNTVCRTITVLPPVACTTPPVVQSFLIQNGASTTLTRDVVLDTVANYFCGSADGFLKFVEFEYFFGAQRWVPIVNAPWVAHSEASQDYPWTLLPTFGIRFMSAWASDSLGNISLAPGQDYVGLVPQTQTGFVAQNGVVFYRFYVEAGQTFSAQLNSLAGDADLYVWGPNGALVAYSNNHSGVDGVNLAISQTGTYQIEVVGYSAELAEYTLDMSQASHVQRWRETMPSSKSLRTSPAVPLTSWPEFYAVEPPVSATNPSTVYLPLVVR